MNFKNTTGAPRRTSRLRTALLASAAATLGAAGAVSAQTDTINALFPYEAEQGFELMFDGANAASFRNLFANYVRNNTTNTNLHNGWHVNTDQTDPDRPGATFGAILNSGGTGGTANVDMRSRKFYRDFDLRFDYRNSGNQGLIYRFDVTGAYSWETGIEFAIENNTSAAALTLTGAAYDLIAPSSTQAYLVRSTNRWNRLRLVVKGDSVEHWINDVKVVGFRYWSEAFLAAYPSSKWTGFPNFCQTAPNNRQYRPEGYIGLQGDHGGAWQIRRMRILHDSLPTQNRVKHGPVDTSGLVSLQAPLPVGRGGFRIDAAAGRLRIAGEEALRAVELRGLNGRVVRRERLKANRREVDLDVAALPQGLYQVRIETQSGAVRLARTLIH